MSVNQGAEKGISTYNRAEPLPLPPAGIRAPDTRRVGFGGDRDVLLLRLDGMGDKAVLVQQHVPDQAE